MTQTPERVLEAHEKQPWQMTEREWNTAWDETRPDGQGYTTRYGGMGQATSEKGIAARLAVAEKREAFLTMGLPDWTDFSGGKRTPRHWHVVRAAAEQGYPVPAAVLREYAGEPWADDLLRAQGD